jgi:hypothetical protein
MLAAFDDEDVRVSRRADGTTTYNYHRWENTIGWIDL